jgi:hypothetical protein
MNPYQPPHASLDRAVVAPTAFEVPHEVLEPLQQTKPWVTFLAILGFIGTGLIVVVGLGIFAMGGQGQLKGWMGGLYILLGVFYLMPSLLLFRYGSSIGRLTVTRESRDLTDALTRQKSFWRLCGIATLVIMCLYAVAIVLGIAAGISRS